MAYSSSYTSSYGGSSRDERKKKMQSGALPATGRGVAGRVGQPQQPGGGQGAGGYQGMYGGGGGAGGGREANASLPRGAMDQPGGGGASVTNSLYGSKQLPGSQTQVEQARGFGPGTESIQRFTSLEDSGLAGSMGRVTDYDMAMDTGRGVIGESGLAPRPGGAIGGPNGPRPGYDVAPTPVGPGPDAGWGPQPDADPLAGLSEEERLIMEQMQMRAGQGVADARAGMAAGGFGVSGAMGQMGADIRAQAARDAMTDIFGNRRLDREQQLAEDQFAADKGFRERELGIMEDAYGMSRDLLEEYLRGGEGGGDGGGGGGGYEPGTSAGGDFKNLNQQARDLAEQGMKYLNPSMGDSTLEGNESSLPPGTWVYKGQNSTGYHMWESPDGSQGFDTKYATPEAIRSGTYTSE